MSLCKECGTEIIAPKRGFTAQTCSEKCKKQNQRQSALKSRDKGNPVPSVEKSRDIASAADLSVFTAIKTTHSDYTADSIRIKTADERFLDPTYDWELAESLAVEYGKPKTWISRSIQACRDAGASPQYFIDRYILKKPIPMDESIDAAFRDRYFKPQGFEESNAA